MVIFTKNMLTSRFDMKDMGSTDVILGIKLIRTLDGLILSQSHYIDIFLEILIKTILELPEVQLM